jgi:hypothetical protein
MIYSRLRKVDRPVRDRFGLMLIAAGILAGGVGVFSDGARAAMGGCIYQQGKAQPYRVLGSVVEPTSNILIVGVCGSSYEELNARYIEQWPSRGVAHLQTDSCARWTSTRSGASCAVPRVD